MLNDGAFTDTGRSADNEGIEYFLGVVDVELCRSGWNGSDSGQRNNALDTVQPEKAHWKDGSAGVRKHVGCVV